MPELDFEESLQTLRMKKSMLKLELQRLKAVRVFILKCVGLPSSHFTE